MFITTIINFLLSSLTTGSVVAILIVFIRNALTLDIDDPLSGKPESVNNALQNMNIVFYWAGIFPVSIKLSLPDPVSIHARGDLAQRFDCHLESLVPFPRSTVGSPHTIYYVDWSRG